MNRRRLVAGFLTLLLTGVAVMTVGAQSAVITIERPVVYPDTREVRATIEGALLQAARHTVRTNPDLLVIPSWDSRGAAVAEAGAGATRSGAGDRYTLTINAIQDSSSNTITLMMTGNGTAEGRQATAIPLMGAWDGDLYRTLSRQIVYTWAQAHGLQRLTTSGRPHFVDELYLGELVGSTITTEGANLYPYSLAATAGGDVVVGAITVALRFGSDFRVVDLPGKQLLDEGNYSSAMYVAVTPAGSIVTRPSMGRELFLYQPGSPEPARLRNPLTGQGAIAALPDGSVVVVDYANRRAARIEGRQVYPLEIFPLEYSYIPAVAAGPEGNIWTYDTSQREIIIYAPDGSRLDSIVPMLPMEQAASVKAIAVGETGDFLLLSAGSLGRFDRTGRPVWSVQTLDDPAASTFASMMSVAWHQPSGSIYLADYMGQRLIRLVEENAPTDSFTREVMRLNAGIRGSAGTEGSAGGPGTGAAAAPASGRVGQLLADKAALYEERGALEMAQAQWQLVLEEDPFSMDAMERIDALESALLRRQVTQLDQRVRTLLEGYGRETARRDYGRTIMLYERILNLEPGLTEVRQAKAALEARFEERDLPGAPEYPLEVTELSVTSLFPVLMQRYREGGAGSIRILNPGNRQVELTGGSVTLAGFSDGPAPLEATGKLMPGSDVTLDLPVALNREALLLQEDLPVQLMIAITYRVDAQEITLTRSEATTLHRRSALIWDDSAKLASFVTPNEDVVAGFALRILAQLETTESAGAAGATARSSITAQEQVASVSTRLLRTIRLADALGSYGINYVEDPRSPFSSVRSGPGAVTRQTVDTVRFPRLTLYYRSGDCDDTSALLASLLEAAGLDTAVVTTPGHVFIAVDTREPEGNRWMFETEETTVIAAEGSLWVPIETTILERGFATAWREASLLVREHLPAGDLEMIPLRSAREVYAALPLPAASFSITEPPAERIQPVVARSAAVISEILYDGGRENLEGELRQRSGSRRIPALNRLGILNARFGYIERAEAAFGEILGLRNDYLPAWINLANLSLAADRPNDALRYLDQAQLLRPAEPAVIELVARAHFIAGNGQEARAAVRQLQELDPARAARLTVILPPSGTAASGRASGAEDPQAALPPEEWLLEE